VPIRGAREFTFRPTGLTDAIDSTNAQPGGMVSLQNLIPSPRDPGVYVPRPAAQKLIDVIPGNFISALTPVGQYVYGFIASTTYAGKDQPFVYDVTNNVLLTITGMSSALLPAAANSSGSWTPPLVFGAGSRIMFLHPGFQGTGNYLGWLDVSNFTTSANFGNTTSGSPVLRSLRTNVGSSAPILSGFQPGMTVTGTGIPAGTYILSMTNGTFSLASTGSTTSGSPSITGVTVLTGVEVGMSISGPQFPTGTYVSALPGGGVVTASQNALSTNAAAAFTFAGGGTVTLSANATATGTSIALTIAGGTTASPQWSAGNLNTNPLATVPICGALFSGRAWYGAGQYAVFSDPLNPTQVSQASQALTVGDQSPITALQSLPLTSQLTGGVQQSLTAYKGASSFFQITGDAATSNLAINGVTGSVGTLAPNTIVQTPQGVVMIASDGLRVLGLNGVQSEPIGNDGKGVALPFIQAAPPSRMAAAFSQNTLRVSVTSPVTATLTPYEYWYDFNKQSWTGPHTFAASLLLAHPSGSGFLFTPLGVNGSLWFGDVIPKNTATFIENGVQLTWVYQTSLLPDNESIAYNTVFNTGLSFSSPIGSPIQVNAVTETGSLLDAITVTPDQSGVNPLWGTMVWGAFTWGAQQGKFRRYYLNWNLPLAFRQARFQASANSDVGQVIGDTFIRYKVMGYGQDNPG
jgi:hypothetical protein